MWPCRRALIACLGVLVLGSSQAAVRWTSSLDARTGLPMLEAAGGAAVAPAYAFWGPNWQYAGVRLKRETPAPGVYVATGAIPLLGLTLETHAAPHPEGGGWDVDFTWDGTHATGTGGSGGIVFHLQQDAWAATMGDPVLLPDNRGWRWGRDGGPQEEVRFDRPLAALYFEKGNKSELRAFFFQEKLPAAKVTVHSTWRFNNHVETLAPLKERLGAGSPDDWPLDELGNSGAVPDLSFLNRGSKPAGRHGPVHVDKDKLVFQDGTPARFWGTNVAAYALFNSTKDEVRAQAKRLASLGYNLVRLHHHDSPWVGYNVFGKRATLTDTRTLDASALEHLDWWIKCLKDEGIYVWLDLHVQRALRAGDHIDGFDEISRGKDTADLKGYSYVNPSIQQAMLRFDEEYLTHKNIFTGVAYKDEPAVVGLLLTNENDVTQHFGNALLPDKKVPFHNKLYADAAKAFAASSGLPADKVWRSWEPGSPKIFLNDLEHRFDDSMIAGLRRLGADAPVATTSSWGSEPVSSLPALTSGDLIDVHTYDMYGVLEKNPLFFADIADWPGAAHVVGYPVTVSEWNAAPFPIEDRHVLPLYMAATATHQGWDALMQFAYTQEPPSVNSPSNWNSYNDPSLTAMMPAAALLYRERHVDEAKTTYVLDLDADTFFGRGVSPSTSVALRTAMERGKVLVAMPRVKELPWLQRHALPAGATVMTDPARSMLPLDASQATSDSGQLTRNWNDGLFTINTPRTRAALGWVGGRTVSLPGFDLEFVTKNASVAVQSLDERPLGTSTNLLVSIGTRSVPQANNRVPFRVEPALGTLKIRAPQGLKVYSLDESGRQVEWPAAYKDGQYQIRFDGKSPVHWLFVH